MFVEICCHNSYSKDPVVILINSRGDSDYIQICSTIKNKKMK